MLLFHEKLRCFQVKKIFLLSLCHHLPTSERITDCFCKRGESVTSPHSPTSAVPAGSMIAVITIFIKDIHLNVTYISKRWPPSNEKSKIGKQKDLQVSKFCTAYPFRGAENSNSSIFKEHLHLCFECVLSDCQPPSPRQLRSHSCVSNEADIGATPLEPNVI